MNSLLHFVLYTFGLHVISGDLGVSSYICFVLDLNARFLFIRCNLFSNLCFSNLFMTVMCLVTKTNVSNSLQYYVSVPKPKEEETLNPGGFLSSKFLSSRSLTTEPVYAVKQKQLVF